MSLWVSVLMPLSSTTVLSEWKVMVWPVPATISSLPEAPVTVSAVIAPETVTLPEKPVLVTVRPEPALPRVSTASAKLPTSVSARLPMVMLLSVSVRFWLNDSRRWLPALPPTMRTVAASLALKVSSPLPPTSVSAPLPAAKAKRAAESAEPVSTALPPSVEATGASSPSCCSTGEP